MIKSLQEKVDEGVELTPLEAERFRGYEAMAAAARASVVAAEAARIQRKVDAMKAEAEAVTGAAIAQEREAALKAQRMEGYRAVFKSGKMPKDQIVYGDMVGMTMVGAINLTHEAMRVIQAGLRNKTLTLHEVKAAFSWMKARERLVTRHGKGSAGYEERIAKTQTVMEQLKRYGAYVKSGRIVPVSAAALTPAVASATMPDSLSAVRALTAERTVAGFTQLMGTDPSILEGVVDDARPRTLRDETTRTMEEWAAADPTVLGVLLTEDLLFRDRVTHSESELKGTLMGAVGVATVVAPEVMVPLLGRMASGGWLEKPAMKRMFRWGFHQEMWRS